MNQIEVKSVDGVPMVSSLVVAEHFGKRHSHVLRDIDALLKTIEKSDDPETGYRFLSLRLTASHGHFLESAAWRWLSLCCNPCLTSLNSERPNAVII